MDCLDYEKDAYGRVNMSNRTDPIALKLVPIADECSIGAAPICVQRHSPEHSNERQDMKRFKTKVDGETIIKDSKGNIVQQFRHPDYGMQQVMEDM